MILTVDRSNAAQRRAESLQGIPSSPLLDRDEYPPAVFKEGGAGSSVRLIPIPEKLVSIASDPLSRSPALIDFVDGDAIGSISAQLKSLLRLRNGFYAFESALHVFPSTSSRPEMTLRRWNSSTLWRFEYGELAEGILFFAEDAFGNQFCLHEGCICCFDAETGELNVLANDLEKWASRLLAEYRVLTGYPLLHEWQEKNGPLQMGRRLMPKIPFVLGGEYALANLYSLATVSAMKSRGNLARQLKGVPDGARVEFRVIE
jgi:hypothetical protein